MRFSAPSCAPLRAEGAAAGEVEDGAEEVMAVPVLVQPSSGPDWVGSAEADGALAAEAGVPVEDGAAEEALAAVAVSAALVEAAPVAAALAEAGNLGEFGTAPAEPDNLGAVCTAPTEPGKPANFVTLAIGASW